jgi:hypothetical protein
MAGSKEKFIYTSDTGAKKILNLDESNCLAIGATPATAALGATLRLERTNGTERYLDCIGQTAGKRQVSRRIIVPTNDNAKFVNGGTLDLPVLVDGTNGTVELVVFSITQAVGEVKKFANFGDDTGLDDGTI